MANILLDASYLIPTERKNENRGNIRTTPEDVSTLTMRDVTVVIRKNASNDIINAPGEK
jgi:hypothetical protein